MEIIIRFLILVVIFEGREAVDDVCTEKIAGPLINYYDERTSGDEKKKISEKVVQLTLPLTERI